MPQSGSHQGPPRSPTTGNSPTVERKTSASSIARKLSTSKILKNILTQKSDHKSADTSSADEDETKQENMDLKRSNGELRKYIINLETKLHVDKRKRSVSASDVSGDEVDEETRQHGVGTKQKVLKDFLASDKMQEISRVIKAKAERFLKVEKGHCDEENEGECSNLQLLDIKGSVDEIKQMCRSNENLISPPHDKKHNKCSNSECLRRLNLLEKALEVEKNENKKLKVSISRLNEEKQDLTRRVKEYTLGLFSKPKVPQVQQEAGEKNDGKNEANNNIVKLRQENVDMLKTWKMPSSGQCNGFLSSSDEDENNRESRKRRITVQKSPDHVAKSPDHVAKSPDHVTKSPEHVTKSLEHVTKSSEFHYEDIKSTEESVKDSIVDRDTVL